MFTKNPCPAAAVVFVVMTDCHDVPPPPPPPAARVISVPLNVNTSPLVAPDCNPGILNEVAHPRRPSGDGQILPPRS